MSDKEHINPQFAMDVFGRVPIDGSEPVCDFAKRVREYYTDAEIHEIFQNRCVPESWDEEFGICCPHREKPALVKTDLSSHSIKWWGLVPAAVALGAAVTDLLIR